MVVFVVVSVPVAAGVVRIGADALDMVVVADLGRAEVALMADDLLAILAELAVHAVVAFGISAIRARKASTTSGWSLR